EQAARAPNLHRAVDERGRLGLGRRVQEAASGLLRALDVWLVERVDAEQSPRDRRRVLPQQELGAERTADLDRRHPAGVGGELRRLRSGHGEREHSGAFLACGLRYELLNPVGEADDAGVLGNYRSHRAPVSEQRTEY